MITPRAVKALEFDKVLKIASEFCVLYETKQNLEKFISGQNKLMPGFVGYGKRVASFTLPAFFTERTIQKLGELDSSE